MSRVELQIGGRPYTVACAPGEEAHIRALGQRVDAKMQTIGGNRWKWAYGFLNIGMVGMVMGLLLAGMAQAFFERAAGGSTLMAYTVASENPWFTSGIWARTGFGFMFALGYVLLVIDLLKAPVPQKESAPLPSLGHAQPEPA